MKKPKEFDFLVDAFKSLPGVGTKSATRYAFFLLNRDQRYKDEFIKRLVDASSAIHKCELCNNLAEAATCSICADRMRDKSLCIVASIEDLDRIEQSHNFFGYYHILDCMPDLKHFKLTSINMDLVKKQIQTLEIKELVIATSFSLIGEAISEYIKNNLSHRSDLSIYRIGFGVPLNANIDYIDNDTIRESLLNKKRIN